MWASLVVSVDSAVWPDRRLRPPDGRLGRRLGDQQSHAPLPAPTTCPHASSVYIRQQVPTWPARPATGHGPGGVSIAADQPRCGHRRGHPDGTTGKTRPAEMSNEVGQPHPGGIAVSVAVALRALIRTRASPLGADHRVGDGGRQRVDDRMQQRTHQIRGCLLQRFAQQPGTVDLRRSCLLRMRTACSVARREGFPVIPGVAVPDVARGV